MLIADSCEDPGAVKQLKDKLETLMANALKDILGSHNNKDSARLNIFPDLCKIIGRLREESDIEDVIYFLLDLYQYNDIPIARDVKQVVIYNVFVAGFSHQFYLLSFDQQACCRHQGCYIQL